MVSADDDDGGVRHLGRGRQTCRVLYNYEWCVLLETVFFRSGCLRSKHGGRGSGPGIVDFCFGSGDMGGNRHYRLCVKRQLCVFFLLKIFMLRYVHLSVSCLFSVHVFACLAHRAVHLLFCLGLSVVLLLAGARRVPLSVAHNLLFLS